MPKKMQDLEFVPSTFMSVFDVENRSARHGRNFVMFNVAESLRLVHDQ